MPHSDDVHEASLRIDGSGVAFSGDLTIGEGLDGIHLHARLSLQDSGRARLGSRVDVTVDGDPGLDLSVWVTQVAESRRTGEMGFDVYASDALTTCNVGRSFSSHAPVGCLSDLINQVLSAHPFRPAGMRETPGPSPALAGTWHLQCQETMWEFLQRKAADTGCAVYPGRDGVALGRCGVGPLAAVPQVSVDRVLALRAVHTADPPARNVAWIEPSSREVRVSRIGPSDRPAGLNVRAVGWGAPLESSVNDDSLRGAHRLEIDTRLSEVALGSLVEVDGRPGPWMAERIGHTIGNAGRYTNRIDCVPASRWGLGLVRAGLGPAGVFQADVWKSDDPSGQGRVRVILAGDPQRRPSPWLPVITMGAGKSSGWHWVPDAGETVIVTGESRCPENLVVLGSIRGSRQPMDPALRGVKGVRVDGDFVIVTSGGTIRITKDGVLDIDANQRINIGGS